VGDLFLSHHPDAVHLGGLGIGRAVAAQDRGGYAHLLGQGAAVVQDGVVQAELVVRDLHEAHVLEGAQLEADGFAGIQLGVAPHLGFVGGRRGQAGEEVVDYAGRHDGQLGAGHVAGDDGGARLSQAQVPGVDNIDLEGVGAGDGSKVRPSACEGPVVPWAEQEGVAGKPLHLAHDGVDPACRAAGAASRACR
jgi:hypothetical protein